jgi:glutamine amidotransferase
VTKVECTLAHAQNTLIMQSDTHRHGWGMAIYRNQKPYIERQAKAAMEDEGFRRAAVRAYSDTVLAHLRRATVGRVALENTHPFSHGSWIFAHNGTLPRFDDLRPKMLRHDDVRASCGDSG